MKYLKNNRPRDHVTGGLVRFVAAPTTLGGVALVFIFGSGRGRSRESRVPARCYSNAPQTPAEPPERFRRCPSAES